MWKRAGEGLSDRLVEGTVKFGGGSVMLWGCMLWDVPGYACRIYGRMCYEFILIFNGRDCQNIFYSKLLPVCSYRLYNQCMRVTKLWEFGRLLTVAS